MMKHILMGSAALAMLAACGPADKDATVKEASYEGEAPTTAKAAATTVDYDAGVTTSTPDVWGDFGLNMDTMDPAVKPGDDFYKYVNGKWLDTFEIPADRSRYGSFTLLAEKSEQRVRKIIEEVASAKPDASTLEGKVAAVYNAYMDTDAIEAAGIAPAQPYLDKINAIETREDLAKAFGMPGLAAPFGGFVDVDSKNTSAYTFYMGYGGLGMGDRDYYLVDNDKNIELRAKYMDMLVTLLEAAGDDDPAAGAVNIYALETALAKTHWDRAAGRNRDLTYNKMSIADVRALAGEFPAQLFIDEIGLSDLKEVVVRQVTPTAEEVEEYGIDAETLEKVSGGGVEGVFEIANEYDIEAWKDWMKVQLLRGQSDVLPAAIDDAVFDFYGKALRGQEEQRERWKRGVSTVEGSVGEAVGKIYADRYFPKANKAAMDDLVANLRKAMASNLEQLDWMGADTKVEAREKLNKFTPKIGYAEKFETYSGLTVGNNAFENAMAVGEWSWEDMLSQLGQPIDKTEWFMLPQTVNAYYSPNRNEIVFPAAILQPPFFNLEADPAINYGGIGGVIGHEIGHGFDDQGSKSDGDGTLRNWWTAEDQAAFKGKTSALAGQYDAFCPLDDGETCVNGNLGLGENIGDLGGLSMALKAYKMSLDKNGDGEISADEEAPVINGLTGDQRFFMAWAQVWRNKYRDDALRAQLVRGPHSPPYYRVNGVVRNFDEWYEAFDVKPGDALYIPPEERIRIW